MQASKAGVYMLGPNGCMRRRKEPKMSDIQGQGQALHTSKETVFALFPSFFRALEPMVRKVDHYSWAIMKVRGSLTFRESLKNEPSYMLRMSCSLFSPPLALQPLEIQAQL